MVKRLLLGLVIGLIMGGLVAGVAVEGLGITMFGGATGAPAAFAYVLAAFTGVAVGLVAGKPIWAKGGQIEAGLKAFFGALLGAGLLFAIRTWLHVTVDLASFHAGAGEIGALPVAAFPLIAMVLGGFYEIDNNGDGEKDGGAKSSAGKAAPKAAGKPGVRVAAAGEAAEAEEDPASVKKQRR